MAVAFHPSEEYVAIPDSKHSDQVYIVAERLARNVQADVKDSVSLDPDAVLKELKDELAKRSSLY